MTILIADYQTPQTLAVTGLASLANGSAVSASPVTSSDWMDYLVRVQLTSSAGAAANGIVTVTVSSSIDGTDFDDANNERIIGVVTFPSAGAQSRSATFLLANGEPLPPSWTLNFRNATGDALSAATVQYRGVRRKTDGTLVYQTVPVDTFTTQAGDGTTSLDTVANTMTIAFGTTATSLRGSYGGLTTGKRYRATWNTANSNATIGQAGFGMSLGGAHYRNTQGGVEGANSFDFTAEQATLYITFQRASTGTTTFSQIRIAEIPEPVWTNTGLILDANWALDAGVTFSSGTLTINGNGTTLKGRNTAATEIGKLYKLGYTIAGTGTIFVSIGTVAGQSQLKTTSIKNFVGTHIYEFTATATTTHFQFHKTDSNTGAVSNISLQIANA